MVSKTVYIKAVLFLVFLFLAFLSLLAFFFMSVFGSFIVGNYVLFFAGLFYFALFIVLMFLVRKLEPAWEELQARFGFKPKPKTTREAFKESLPSFGILILALAIYGIIEWYFNLFPTTISKGLAGEMVRSIMTIDGILLGFYGIILAQFLWAIHSKGNLIYEQMITHRQESDVVAHLSEESERLNRHRLWVVASVFYAVTPILTSFLLCLVKLPLSEGSGVGNDTIAVRTVMYDPTALLVVGIILMVGVSLATNLLPRRGRWPAEATPTP